MSRGRELAKLGGIPQTISGISTFVGISTFGSDVRIHGKLDVDGDISYDEMTSVNSKVSGVSTITDVRVDRNLNVAGITTVTGALDANGGANISGAETILSSATVSDLTDNRVVLAGTSGALEDSGNLTFDGSTLAVTGDETVSGNITVTGNIVGNGDVDLGNATSDTITATGRFDSDIVPSTDGARDLGASGLEFKDLYIDGTANIDALVADTAIVSDLTDNRIVLAGTSGELEDSAALTFDGTTLNLTGNQQNSGTLTVSGETTLASAKVSDLTNNRVVIAGTAGAIEDSANLTFDGSTLDVNGDIEGFTHTSAPHGSTTSLTVTVVTKDATHRYNGTGSSSGYAIDGVQSPTLHFTPGRTYRFVHDNTGSHPLKFYLEADKTTNYTTGVSFQDSYTEITVGDETPAILHYQCTSHAYMGNVIVTNSNVVNTNYAGILRGGLNVSGAETVLSSATVSDLTQNRLVYAGASGALSDSTNLTYNGSTLTHTGTTTLDGDVNFNGASYSALWDFSQNSLEFSDNAYITLGTGRDLAIYHNGTAGYIDSAGSDTLFIRNGTTGGSIKIQGNSGEESIIANHNGSVELYHDGTKRFETSSVGATLTGKLTVSGDLQIDGTTTTVNSTTMTVDDKNITLGSGAANDAACDGSGITAESGDGNKTFNWVDSTDAWTSSEHLDLASGKGYKLNGTTVLSGTTLGSSIVTSSLTSLGTISTGVWNATAIGNDYIATITALNKVAVSSLDIDGGTDIGADLVDADEIIVDDGGGGTNRRSDLSRVKKYIFSAASGDATASDSGAITLANSGVTAGTVGSSSAIPILTIDAKGRITSTSTSAVDSTAITQGNSSMSVVDSGTGSIVAAIDGSTLATFAAAGITLSSGAFVGNLTGNVTGNTSGSSGSCTGNAATATKLAATKTIAGVAFDGSSNISLNNNAITNGAGYITSSGTSAACSGNAASATVGTNVTVSANNTANETVYPLFVDGATGTQGCETDTSLSYNPSSNTLTAGTFSGSLSGTASNAALLDSLDSSQFVRSDTADTITATLTARAITPQADSTYDLGTNSVRWANVYADDVRTGDLHLSNEHRGGNTIDGSWGHYQIQEGEDDLFIMNKRSGKKFRFVLEQV